MGKVLVNEKLSEEFYLLQAEDNKHAEMGQFYMLRGWEEYPVLSRPISVYDADGETVSFLYKKVGKGTELLTEMKPGSELTLEGPFGNGFPKGMKGRVALVGGGVGIAPLYLAAKTYQKSGLCDRVDIYLGFSTEPILTEQFQSVADKVSVDVGGFITDSIDPLQYDAIVTCGPEIMMKILHEKCKKTGATAPLYVSMENRMACGIGMCKVCTCKTKSGNRTACKDGPVFLGSEVFDNE